MGHGFGGGGHQHRGGGGCCRGAGGGGRGALVEAAALAALLGTTAHGYDLRRRIEELTAGHLEVDAGGLYRVLRRLEDEGFVVSKWSAGEAGPQRRDYEITAEGRDLAGDWVPRLRDRQEVFGLLADALDRGLDAGPVIAGQTGIPQDPGQADLPESAQEQPRGQAAGKVAISALGPSLDDRLDERFGRANYLLIVDPQTMEVQVVDNNRNQQALQGAGLGAAEKVLEHGATAVLTGHLGPKAYGALQSAGIAGFNGTGMTAREALEAWKIGRLARLDEGEGHQGIN